MQERFIQRDIEESRDFKKGQKKVVLEIGVGGVPHFDEQILGEKMFSKEDTYVAFDITESRLHDLKENHSLIKENKESSIQLVRGDAVSLPFLEDSVDTVILPDILNSTVITPLDKNKDYDAYKYWRRQDISLNQNKKAALDESLKAIVDESVRVLKPGGQLVLIQRYKDENKTVEESPYLKTVGYIGSKLGYKSSEKIPAGHLQVKKTIFIKPEK